MAICEYLILVIFGQFWLFRANFGPGNSKEYFFQLFRCKKNNGIIKSGSVWLFQKLVPHGTPKPTPGPKRHPKGPRRAKIGINASHAVQLTSLRPKKNRFESDSSKVCSFDLESTEDYDHQGGKCGDQWWRNSHSGLCGWTTFETKRYFHPLLARKNIHNKQGCIIRSILPSGMGARGVSSEHVENMEMFSCSPT